MGYKSACVGNITEMLAPSRGFSRSCCWMTSECSDVKNYKWRLNPVWHRMLYSCTHMATVGVKGLILHCVSDVSLLLIIKQCDVTVTWPVYGVCSQQLYRKKPGMTMEASRLMENLPKNRYRDISPCTSYVHSDVYQCFSSVTADFCPCSAGWPVRHSLTMSVTLTL